MSRGLLLPLLVLWPLSVSAQSPADLVRAKESFKAGAVAYGAGEYLAAIQALDAAYTLTPLPAIAFSLAQAERRQYFVAHESAHLERAIELFRRYIEQVPSGGRRADAIDALSQLEPLAAAQARVATPAAPAAPDVGATHPTRLMITAEAPMARLSIDGGPPVASPLIREVDAGKHRVAASAPGFFTVESDVTAVPGELIPLAVALHERPSTIAISTSAAAEIYVDGRFMSRGGPSLALTLPSGGHRLAVVEKGHRPSTRQLDLARGEAQTIQIALQPTRQRRASNLLFISGGVGLGAGVILAVLAARAQDRAEAFLGRQSRGNVTAADLAAYDADVTERNRDRDAAVISLAAAAGLSLTALLLRELDQPDRDDLAPSQTPPSPASPALAPLATSGGFGIVLSSGF